MSGEPQGWATTYAHLRAVVVAGSAALGALVLQRPDLLVLGTPFAIVAVWSLLTRPTEPPEPRVTISGGALREGRWAAARTRVPVRPHVELVSTSVAPAAHLQFRPPRAARTRLVEHRPEPGSPSPAETVLALGVRPTRWGSRTVGPVLVGASSAWGAFRWGPHPQPERTVLVLPDPAVFDSRAPAPHPRGLVGLHRSVRPGDGSEFASIRPFQWGDRLKRIHWARSLRTGELHVTSSYADQDTRVEIVVDASYDLGRSGGVDGAPSTLDHSVRAAAAIAEHYAHQGDRVALEIVSARTPLRVAPGSGRRHQRRVLQSLAAVRPAPTTYRPDRLRRTVPPAGSLVVLISALVSPDVLTRAATLNRSGVSVVVIDALVADVEPPGEQDVVAGLAWRIRMVERDREVRRIQEAGVPVVPWAGPGSLDLVLRRLARHGGQRGAAV